MRVIAPVSSIAMILGLITDVPSAIGLFTDHSGNIAVTYKGENVDGVRERNVVVCIDDVKSVSELNGIYPTFSNNTSYSVNNFSMRYNVESKSVMFEPADFYNMAQEGEGNYIMKYKETMLPAFSTVERPIRKFIVAQNGGKLNLAAQASFDGIEKPITYNVHTTFFVIPYTAADTYDQWKQRCQTKFLPETKGLDECDVYYISKNNGIEQEINFRLGNNLPGDNRDIAQTVGRKATAPMSPKTASTPQTKQPANTSSPKTAAAPAVPAYQTQQVAKNSTSEKRQPLNLRLDKYPTDSDGRDYIRLSFDNVTEDTTVVMLVLLEDSLTLKQSNDLWMFNLTHQRNNSSERIYKLPIESGLRVVDYAFCTENLALRDSVEISDDYGMKNPTLRSIGVCMSNASDSSYHYFTCLLRPADAEGSNSKDIDKSLISEFNDIHYYELPEALLVKENKPIGKYTWLIRALTISIYCGFVFAGIFMFLILLFGFFAINDNWKHIESASDFSSVLQGEFEAKSTAALLVKWLVYIVSAYIIGCVVFFIILIISHFLGVHF